MRTLLGLAAAAALAATIHPGRAAAAPISEAPAGAYRADMAHTSLNFRISHLGLSRFTARFTRLEAVVHFDPAHPEAQSVTATIDANSLQTNYPEPAKLNFDAQIEKEFLGADKFPQITFKSTKVEVTGERTARVTGDLTLHGVSKPVVLETSFNGGYKAGGMDPMGNRIGFSAHGVFKRSDFGLTAGLPPPGTSFGVGDEIEVAIEGEFTMK